MLQINYLEIHHDFLTTLPSETLDAIKPYIQSEWKNYSSDKETANKDDISRIEQRAVYRYLKIKALAFCTSPQSIRTKDLLHIQEFYLREEVSKKYRELIQNNQLFFDLINEKYKIFLEAPELFFKHEWQFQRYFVIKMKNFTPTIKTELVKYNSQNKKRILDIYIPLHNLGIELKRGCKPKYTDKHENQRLLYEHWFQCKVLLIYASQCHTFFNILSNSGINVETIKALRILF